MDVSLLKNKSCLANGVCVVLQDVVITVNIHLSLPVVRESSFTKKRAFLLCPPPPSHFESVLHYLKNPRGNLPRLVCSSPPSNEKQLPCNLHDFDSVVKSVTIVVPVPVM